MIRIYFQGHAASEPLIAHFNSKNWIAIKYFASEFGIYTTNYTIGIMVAAVLDNQQHLHLGIDYLTQQRC